MHKVQKLIIQFLKKKYKTQKLSKEILEKEGLDFIVFKGKKPKIMLVGKIQRDIMRWAKKAENNPKTGLLIMAPPGTGKTQAVKYALTNLLNLPYVWLDLPDIYERDKKESFFEELPFAKIVVIDEIRKPFAERDESIFFLEQVISKIYQAKKIPIFIFNPSKEEFGKLSLGKLNKQKIPTPGLSNLSDIAVSKLAEITKTLNYIDRKTFNFRYIKAQINRQENFQL